MPVFPLVVTHDKATLNVGVSAPIGYLTPATRPRTWMALVDTGASMSVTSPAVVQATRPPQIAYESVGRAGGVSSYARTFDIRFRLGGHASLQSQWFALEVAEIDPATPGVDVIIGMDLLARLELVLYGASRFGFLAY